jgi:D-amino-acid dehydrogenase
MRVAVIGAGVAGVTTAYFLAQNGHQVTVIEQRGNVCEQASLGHAGLLGAAHLMPLAAPGMPRQIISHWFKSNGSLNLRPSLNLSNWRWLRSWMHESTIERMLVNKEKMQRLGKYGQQLLVDISHTHKLEFEQRAGILQLFRHAKDQLNITAGLDLLKQTDIPFQQMDEAACRLCEPTLNPQTPIAGGIYFPQDSQGNCVLFTKQLKNIVQQMGVEFEFLTTCERIVSNHNGVTLQLKQENQIKNQQFDLAVLAAGEQSGSLFNDVGLTLRVANIQSYSNTANIKNVEDTPRISIIDESAQVAITRMDKRIRVAGTWWSGNASTSDDQRAWQVLRNTGTDWFPDAANYHTGLNWRGNHLMLPDNAPLLGPAAEKNVYLNIAHAEYGWSMALGSAKAIADLISGKTPDINLDGLNLIR